MSGSKIRHKVGPKSSSNGKSILNEIAKRLLHINSQVRIPGTPDAIKESDKERGVRSDFARLTRQRVR